MSEKETKVSYFRGDDVHNPKLNLTGYIKAIENDTLTVGTANGVHKWNVNEVELLRNERDLEAVNYTYVLSERFNENGEITHEWTLNEEADEAKNDYDEMLENKDNFSVTMLSSTIKSTDYFTSANEEIEKELLATAKGPFMVLAAIYTKEKDIVDKCFIVDDLNRAQKLYEKMCEDPNLYVASIVCNISESNVYKNGEPYMTSLKNNRERLPESVKNDIFQSLGSDDTGLSM